VEVLVLDEADRMFDMGFLPDVRQIVRAVPRQRQTLLFSATMPDDIRVLAREVLHDPLTVQVGEIAPVETVSHALYPVPQHLKSELLMDLLPDLGPGSVLIFTRTKHRAKRLAQQLTHAGFRATALQGNLSQNQRTTAMEGFRKGTFQIMVATDIAARGIDVLSISHVINYDMPDTTDAYTHRIGRTGRAERTGEAYTLVTPEDNFAVRDIERVLGYKLERRHVEGFDYQARAAQDLEAGRPPRMQPRRSAPPARPARPAQPVVRNGNLQPAARSTNPQPATHNPRPRQSLPDTKRMAPSPVTGPCVDPLATVPPPAGRRLALRVNAPAQRALRQGHPWLYAEAITDLRGEGKPGDLAVIFDDHRRFLAIGLYDPGSPIRVRVLQHGAPAAIDHAWLCDRLLGAYARRAALAGSETTGYRLVHGENDGLPGLVIDRYDTTLVLKLYTTAWLPWLPDLRSALEDAFPERGKGSLVLRLSRDVQRRPESLYGLSDGIWLAGAPVEEVVFTENGLRFAADVVRGQKTGFFLDQRDNRARVERLAAGRHTLNVFSYSGGFSLYAARGGAPEVTSLDASAPALAAAKRNFYLNRHIPAVAAAHHALLEADAFDALSDLHRERRRFDLVIVDPPSLAAQRGHLESALQAYARLTNLALGVLAPAGALVMCSCSARVGADEFFSTVSGAAARAGRPLHEIERTGRH
jgi:23S rRNA (cytosine1962-C5)-methyltransferase